MRSVVKAPLREFLSPFCVPCSYKYANPARNLSKSTCTSHVGIGNDPGCTDIPLPLNCCHELPND